MTTCNEYRAVFYVVCTCSATTYYLFSIYFKAHIYYAYFIIIHFFKKMLNVNCITAESWFGIHRFDFSQTNKKSVFVVFFFFPN